MAVASYVLNELPNCILPPKDHLRYVTAAGARSVLGTAYIDEQATVGTGYYSYSSSM